MKPQPPGHQVRLLSACFVTIWKISSPSVFVRSCYEKSHFSVFIRRAGTQWAVSPSQPRHNSPRLRPCASPPPGPPAAHLARLSLSLWQCPPPLPQSRLSREGAHYVPRPATGAVVSSIMSQTSRDAWEREGRGILRGTKRGSGKQCSHFLSFISSWCFSPTVP